MKLLGLPLLWQNAMVGSSAIDEFALYASYDESRNNEHVTGIAAVAMSQGADFIDVWDETGKPICKKLGITKDYLDGYMDGWNLAPRPRKRTFVHASNEEDMHYVAGLKDGRDGIMPCFTARLYKYKSKP